MTRLVVETADLAAASHNLGVEVADPLAASIESALARMASCGGMGGDDPGGAAWAAAYDRAADAAVKSAEAVVNGCYQLSAMFAQTARNYERADAASTSGVRDSVSAAMARLPDPTRIRLSPDLPSALGGSGGLPVGWDLVEHLLSCVWPNGHQDRLHTAAMAWSLSAETLSDRSDYAALAAILTERDRLPESDDMVTACDAMAEHLRSVSHVHGSLAQACLALSAHIDTAHSAIEHELVSLLEWSAGIQVLGGALSLVSFGTAEAPTQSEQVGRIAATAARIVELVAAFVKAAKDVADSIPTLTELADEVSARLERLTRIQLAGADLAGAPSISAIGVRGAGGARSIYTVEMSGELGAETRLAAAANGDLRDLPKVETSAAQIEAKFKHASDFGVTEPRGSEGFSVFRDRIEAFVNDVRTQRVSGTYRGQPAILNYDPETRLAVVQHTDGTFWSCWKLRAGQFANVVERRSLGGG